METTGINKTVYRSDVISALDSFTSVRNVLAWEMFQDGQVRNYDGVINDLQRLYSDINFGSVTENIDPESIAADEDAIYALVDNIINKLIESGISKDNFNYAIWACDDPENVADTYGVDIDDVSAYKITDGILLQDLGYEGQLYGVAEYPEEEWDVIESALKGGNMKTREDYKKYYLEQLTEQFGDMTERDYNSAQKFCYDEEWNLGEVGNMAEAIDGLGDAWKEYQKQYKEGFEIMNGVTSSKKNITSGRWNVKTNEDQMDYIGNFFEGLPSYIDAESPYNEEKFVKAVNDYIFGWMYEDSDFSESAKKQITQNFLKLYKDYYNNGTPKLDLNSYYFDGEGPKDPRLIEWLHTVLSDKELNVPFTTWEYKGSQFVDENDPDNPMNEYDMQKYIREWVDNGEFKKLFDNDKESYAEYFDDFGNPKWYKIYKDFLDIGSNGAFSEINSSRRNDIIKSGYKDNYGIEDLKLTSEQAEEYAGNILSAARDWISSKEYNQFQKKEFKSGDWTVVVDPDGTFSWNGAGLGIYYYYKTQYCPIFEKEYKLNQQYDYESQGWNNLLVQTPRRANGLGDLTAGNSEKTNSMGIDWKDVLRTLKTVVSSKRRNNMIKSEYDYTNSPVTKYVNAQRTIVNLIKKYNYQNRNYEFAQGLKGADNVNLFPMNVPADDFTKDRDYLEAVSVIEDFTGKPFDLEEFKRENVRYINSSRRNNMKIQSGYTGTNVSVEYGPYGEEKEFPLYDITGETVEEIDEELGYYDEVKTVWGSDGESYMILESRAYSEDKIAVLEDDYNEWVEAMSNEDYSKLLGNSRKAIKSANGSWEYQSDDMDEVEKKIGDIGISFTEPLLLADDGTLYTRAGFDQWLKYLEREESDNWADAYDIYHRDTDEEFIKMCQDDFFQHDFGHTLTIYPEGLKSIAESVAEEIPSNEAPFAIPSGFAFNLYGEEEEPSGFNSYWIDDMSLDSESFIWGINPEFGNRFDVAIDPDYLWNGTENIQSSKKGEKKMKIQSKRLIKSGTSNFGSNDDVFGYSFPLVTYIAENYMYDEETDSETEERDYDADSWEYEDAIDNAKALADEMDIPQYDDYSEPYLCHEPFMIKFRDGYYKGVWIEVKEGTDEEDIYNTNEYGSYYDGGRPFTDEEMNKFADKLNEYFNKLCSDYGWQKLGVTARFSNGETMYHKIDNSRKPIQSANYDGIKKQMQYTLDVLKEDAEDSDEEYAERMGYDGTDAGAVRYAINRFKNEYGIRNRYNVVNQSEIADWLAGLPLSFDYANYNILQKGVEWGYLPPIQEGTDLTRKEANWLDNWWNGLANNILKLARKYNVGITSSRKSVTSGLTFRQAVQDFKAAGQWNDYYEMQQDWESYKDGLERDGVISEKTRSTWGNPCTPEAFKRWNK